MPSVTVTHGIRSRFFERFWKMTPAATSARVHAQSRSDPA